MQRPTLKFEQTYWSEGALVAGVDEVGRGPLAGPLVAAAVVLPPGERRRWQRGINDSKVVLPEQRRELCRRILDNCDAVGLGVIQAWELDRLGMTGGVAKAMHMALANAGIHPDVVLIDGKMLINAWPDLRPAMNGVTHEDDPWTPTQPSGLNTTRQRRAQLVLPGTPEPQSIRRNGAFSQRAIVDGDARCLSIAAASIVAKVARDHIMEVLHHDHPRYNWVENKGYSTPEHKRAIREHGTCYQHRQLFAPVRYAMQGVLNLPDLA